MTEHTWSPQQQAFIDWAVTGKGSCVLEAVAGAGKTTTLLEAAQRMPGTVAIMAYNKKIADEIKGKLAARGVDWKKAEAGTVHSFGFRAYRKAHPQVRVDEHKVRDILDRLVPPTHALAGWRGEAAKLVGLAKQTALGIVGRADDYAAWVQMAEHFDVFDDDDDHAKPPVREVVELAQRALAESNQDLATIDFDDMVYLPLLLRLRFWQYDAVMVDEAQDTNAARRALVRAIVKKGGRVIAVGDRHQAIYGFCHPRGTLIKTPAGYTKIEDIAVGDAVITADTAGAIFGWKGGNPVKQVHKYYHTGSILTLHAGDRSVTMTPHHKVPVKVDLNANYYTYMMRRQGVYRVGHCKTYTTSGDFMLTHRVFMENAEAAWLLGSHPTKEDAVAAEKYLLRRIKGCTFQKMTDKEVRTLAPQEGSAFKILAEHGRMADFPLFTQDKKRFARNGAFVTEACNLMEGMRIAFYSDDQAAGGKHGKRQSFNWTSITISSKPFSGYVYGITVTPPVSNYECHSLPLYFAGDDILVHNTGADADSLDLIAQDFNCVKLPLTTTYRCPKSVVAFSRQWVGHIEAAATAPEGAVSTSTMEDFLNRAEYRDSAVLCRTTKPLVALAFTLIRRKVPCRIEGRDVGERLKKLITRWKVKTLDALEDRLESYLARETTKCLAKKQETKLTEVEDVVETIRVIIDQCRREGKHTVQDAADYVASMFGDNVGGMLVLSTIHKSKGREWRLVFWLDRRGTCPSKWARQEWQQEQERNLCYVAATRAQEELVDLLAAEPRAAEQPATAAA